jgi:hypothetical protein
MGKKALPEDLNSLKVTELKEALKERSLSTGGLKSELIARLQEFVKKQSTTSSEVRFHFSFHKIITVLLPTLSFLLASSLFVFFSLFLDYS